MLPYILNPQWKVGPDVHEHEQMFILTNCQKGNLNNRPLDKNHVAALERLMKTAIRRTEPGDRLRVSMSLKNFETSLVYTVQELQRVWESNAGFPEYTIDSLRTAIRDAFHMRGGPIPPTYEELSLMTRQEWDNTTYHQNHRQALMGKPPGAALPWSFIPMAHLACHRRPALAGRSLRVADELVIHDNLRTLATIISDNAT